MFPVIDDNGKKKFVGKEDPKNPPVFVRSPQMRYCPKCRHEDTNEKTNCSRCSSAFDDNKMECPICHKYYEYLLGDDVGGGKRGCEVDWKPPTGKVTYGNEATTGEVFD